MTKLAITLIAIVLATAAQAQSCWYETTYIDGKMISCSVCQHGNQLVRNCLGG